MINQKELYIPERLGIERSQFSQNTMVFLLGVDPEKTRELELEQIRIFEKSGFRIRRGENPLKDKNPNALGIHAEEHFFENTIGYIDFLRGRARELGAKFPKEFTWEELLTTQRESPIVAKYKYSNRGKDKFLLQTPEDKIRFLIWELYGSPLLYVGNQRGWSRDGIPIVENYDTEHSQEKLEIALKFIERQRKTLETLVSSNGEPIGKKKISEEFNRNGILFQEVIKNISGMNTSYRVLVDAKGEVYYTCLWTSKFAEDDEVKKRRNLLLDSNKNHPWEFVHHADSFLYNPNSPLYVKPFRITSNRETDKEIILTSSTRKLPNYSEEEKEILRQLNLNSKNPQLPPEIIDFTKRLAYESRKSYPYIGIDFIQDLKGNFYFLEANNGPDFCPKGIGFTKIRDSSRISLEIMRRIARKY